MKGKEKIHSKAFFLIDGSYFLYRSYFALPPLHTASGHPTHATYAFCRTINKLAKDFNPSHLAVVWDSKGGSTKNKELFAAYKATRPEPPSDLFIQKQDIVDFLKVVKIACISQEGYEADDLIGSLVKDNTHTQVVIVCPDKDMYQLLHYKNVLILDPFKDRIVDEQLYIQEHAFSPEKVPFYYALLGDSSDNIPGVKGVGKKTALELVQQFSSLDDLYANLDNIEKPRTKKLLEESKSDAYMSLKLFTLDHVSLGITSNDCPFDKKNWHEAKDFFTSFGFTSLLKELEKNMPTLTQQTLIQPDTTTAVPTISTQQPSTTPWHCEIITSITVLKELISNIMHKGFCALDTETTGVLPLIDDLVGLSFAYDNNTAYYIPLKHPDDPNYPQLPTERVLAELTPMLSSASIKKALHNAKFDELVLWNNGVELNGVEIDTVIAANITKLAWQKINLKDLSQHYLDEPMQKFKEVMGTKYKKFSEVPIDLAARYAAHDALQTLKLKDYLEKALDKDERLKNFFFSIEMPLYKVLVKMEKRGILLNPQRLKEVEINAEQALLLIEEKLFAALPKQAQEFNGDRINLNSPKQIECLLFDHLNLPIIKKTHKGERSTDNEVLTALSKIHPIPGLIIQYREITKLLSTYLKPLPTFINPKTHRIHTSFSQTMVITGRLSSNNPNLQNIPASESYGVKLRSAFTAGEGNILLSADYSQIELRVLAHLSKDPKLIEAFKNNIDIHAQTASQLFSTTIANVTHEQRQIAKRINFSIIYGLTPFSLAKEFEISPSQAKEYIDTFFNQYPKVQQWMENTVHEAIERGYVESVWGKRRYIPELQEHNKTQQNAGRRFAINTPVQATTADIVKIAMIKINETFEKAKLQAEIILQIHDEIIIELPQEELSRVKEIVQSEMENIVDWEIPLQVSIRTGLDWGEITK